MITGPTEHPTLYGHYVETPNPSDYEVATAALDSLGSALHGLVVEVLAARQLAVHSITYRVKSRESAETKLARSADRYEGLSDIQDLLGVRVITYFPDEVDAVAKALTPEFVIDAENSVDKRQLHEADRFGYMSLHYVASLDDKRASLVEYSRFRGIQFELQVRSILQHAWAEIEHDLGYKADGALPRDVRRRFSRLAGLLELADDEFAGLRNDLHARETEARALIVANPAAAELDQSTVLAMISAGELADLDAAVAACFPAALEPKVNPRTAGMRAGQLRALGIDDVETLREVIRRNRPYVLAFARRWLAGSDRSDAKVNQGIALFYLEYVLAAQADSSIQALWLGGRRISEKKQPALMSRVNDVWQEVVAELGPPPSPDGN